MDAFRPVPDLKMHAGMLLDAYFDPANPYMIMLGSPLPPPLGWSEGGEIFDLGEGGRQKNRPLRGGAIKIRPKKKKKSRAASGPAEEKN